MIKIGAQYYTIRDNCQTLEDFDTSCKKVSEMGYKNIQLSGIGDFSADEIKPIIDKYGLRVVCTHRPLEKYLNDIEGEIKFHKTLGCKICGIGSCPYFWNREDRKEIIDRFVGEFKPVVKRLEEEGLVFAYHNHAVEFEKLGGKHLFDILVEEMASKSFKFILDVYWLAFAGINPSKFIREHKDIIACVHFKDLKVIENTVYYAEIGNGNLEWDEIISACEEAGVEDALVEQDNYWYDDDPFKSLEISRDFLKTKKVSF